MYIIIYCKQHNIVISGVSNTKFRSEFDNTQGLTSILISKYFRYVDNVNEIGKQNFSIILGVSSRNLKVEASLETKDGLFRRYNMDFITLSVEFVNNY